MAWRVPQDSPDGYDEHGPYWDCDGCDTRYRACIARARCDCGTTD